MRCIASARSSSNSAGGSRETEEEGAGAAGLHAALGRMTLQERATSVRHLIEEAALGEASPSACRQTCLHHELLSGLPQPGPRWNM